MNEVSNKFGSLLNKTDYRSNWAKSCVGIGNYLTSHSKETEIYSAT